MDKREIINWIDKRLEKVNSDKTDHSFRSGQIEAYYDVRVKLLEALYEPEESCKHDWYGKRQCKKCGNLELWGDISSNEPEDKLTTAQKIEQGISIGKSVDPDKICKGFQKLHDSLEDKPEIIEQIRGLEFPIREDRVCRDFAIFQIYEKQQEIVKMINKINKV